MKQWLLLFVIFVSVHIVYAADVPTLNAYVTDNAEIISPEVEQQLNELMTAIEKETTAELAILTITSLEGSSKEDYALEVVEKNKIGKKDVDNGLLILVAMEDRVYRVEVGYGLEGFITDAKKVDIGVKILETNFKQGNYDKGVYDAVAAIGQLIQGEEEILSQYQMQYASAQPSMGTTLYGMITFLVFLSILATVARRKSGGFFFFPILIGGPRGGFSGGTGGFGSSGFGGFGGGGFGGGGFGGSF